MPQRRFVILHHTLPESEHWDFMVELDYALATWKLPAPPNGPSFLPMAAKRMDDHRKKYLVYEGPVGGNRGRVVRYDRGVAEIEHSDAQRWVVKLEGAKLTGTFVLTREGVDTDVWRLDAARPA